MILKRIRKILQKADWRRSVCKGFRKTPLVDFNRARLGITRPKPRRKFPGDPFLEEFVQAHRLRHRSRLADWQALAKEVAAGKLIPDNDGELLSLPLFLCVVGEDGAEEERKREGGGSGLSIVTYRP